MTASPWAMYLVARKDVRLGRATAMSLAGAAAVRCQARFAGTPEHGPAFSAWAADDHRKVALRATPEEFARIAAQQPHAAAGPDPDDPVLLCLVPTTLDGRSDDVAALPTVSDFRSPASPPEVPEDASTLWYVVRPGVLRTTGKAMAQAGHGALAYVDGLAAAHPEAHEAWVRDGMLGTVLVADADRWADLRARPDTAVVVDSGFTQVAAGTETVLTMAPSVDRPAALRDLAVLG